MVDEELQAVVGCFPLVTDSFGAGDVVGQPTFSNFVLPAAGTRKSLLGSRHSRSRGCEA